MVFCFVYCLLQNIDLPIHNPTLLLESETIKTRKKGMRDKRIKLIYFSLGGSEIKDYALGWRKLLLLSLMLVILIAILTGTVISVFTDVYNNSQVMSLQEANTKLIDQLAEMRKDFKKVAQRVKGLEGDDDELRMIAGLEKIDQDTRLAGVGGPEADYSNDFDFLPNEMREEVFKTKDVINQLKRKIQILDESRIEIGETLKSEHSKIKHLPTIRPVRIGRITAQFGYRIDPFTEKRTPHHGIDIGAPIGTPVFAAADGTVLRIISQYSPNKGYGKLVEIDHGNGHRTRYGHLSKITVRRGQKVKRWDVIGNVGNTGRSTGPHLHYEILASGKRVNPLKYFFE